MDIKDSYSFPGKVITLTGNITFPGKEFLKTNDFPEKNNFPGKLSFQYLHLVRVSRQGKTCRQVQSTFVGHSPACTGLTWLPAGM